MHANVREKAGPKVLVIFNLLNMPQSITVKEKDLQNWLYSLFMYTAEPLTSKPWQVEQWGYVVYKYE